MQLDAIVEVDQPAESRPRISENVEMFQNEHAVASQSSEKGKDEHLETVAQENQESKQSFTSQSLSNSSDDEYEGESYDSIEVMRQEMIEMITKLDKQAHDRTNKQVAEVREKVKKEQKKLELNLEYA